VKKIIAAILMAAGAAISFGASAAIYSTTLSANQGLRGGDELVSANGRFSLTLQSGDGNLVVYRKSDMKPMWASYKMGGTLAVVQGDGNFVVYNENAGPLVAIWSSQTAKPTAGNVVLKLEDNGGLTLTYNGSKTWSTLGEPPCGGAPLKLYPLCITTGSTRYSTDWPGCDWSEAAANARQEYPWATVNLGYCR
jgi:hypothetical protein